MKFILHSWQKGKWSSAIQISKGLGKTPIKADMFSSPDNRVIRDPLNADIRDLDVSSALLRMWYHGLEAKGY